MDKQNILQQLQQLTTTEEIALKRRKPFHTIMRISRKSTLRKMSQFTNIPSKNTFLVSYENDRRIADFLRQASS
ncbi:hypothetical protein NGG61_08955 [Enterococcus casseliflavus]|uniref:hypothetical protein n=1 Tax=Enterococcus casseliflavus TaxID=37734 RepID=UPI002DBFA091|nr:hypothetical protein [Enterococcus casseliflavus]MEB8400049.1 hypothetical protein [Enterococcus casseliflavus]